jgi:hypothetical protein
MRKAAAVFVLILGGCTAPQRVQQPKPDPTGEPAYLKAVEQLAALNRETADLLKQGRADEAAANITEGQPLQAQLLAAPRPTLPAMEAVSDLDELYARMLLSNHHDGWARMLFQKNIVRWKTWKPQTANTARRLKQAEEWVAQCDRILAR